MRSCLALCLALLFALVHPGAAAVASPWQAVAQSSVTDGADAHKHRDGVAGMAAGVITGTAHPCCPGMAGRSVSDGKAAHCALDGGFLGNAAPVRLMPPVAHHPSALPVRSVEEADPDAILHPPMGA